MGIVVSRDGAVALVEIDRQASLNALDIETVSELEARLRELSEDTGVRCVVLTGAGDRAFIGGADLEYMSKVTSEQAREFAEVGHEVGRLLETMPKPTIAAVNGYALGGGCEVALACDIRYASSNAKLGQPEVSFGLIPGWGGSQRLARTTTLGFAKELIFTGRYVGAEEALRRGLVDAVVDPVLDKALESARDDRAQQPVRRGCREAALQPRPPGVPHGEPGGGVRAHRRGARQRRRARGHHRLPREAGAGLRHR